MVLRSADSSYSSSGTINIFSGRSYSTGSGGNITLSVGTGSSGLGGSVSITAGNSTHLSG